VIDLRLAQCEPTDLRGVPHVTKDGRTMWALPDFLPKDGSGILFLDEITSAPPSVQAAAYQLTLTPEDFGIPSTWMVIAAGNRKSDRGVTFNIAAPLQNRMCDIEIDSTLDDFTNYAVTQDIHPSILAFLRDRPDMLHKFEGGNDIKAFPNPRSWFAVSDVLELDVPDQDRIEMIRGDIGDEAAGNFEAHLRIWETMPRIDDILAGKDVPMPTELNVLYCVAMGLAMRVDKSNLDNAWKFIEHLQGDIQTLVMKLAYKRDTTITHAAAFAQWAAKNSAAFSKV